MKIGLFLAEIEPKTLKKTHFGLWVVGEGRLLEGGVYWVFYGTQFEIFHGFLKTLYM